MEKSVQDHLRWLHQQVQTHFSGLPANEALIWLLICTVFLFLFALWAAEAGQDYLALICLGFAGWFGWGLLVHIPLG